MKKSFFMLCLIAISSKITTAIPFLVGMKKVKEYTFLENFLGSIVSFPIIVTTKPSFGQIVFSFGWFVCFFCFIFYQECENMKVCKSLLQKSIPFIRFCLIVWEFTFANYSFWGIRSLGDDPDMVGTPTFLGVSFLLLHLFIIVKLLSETFKDTHYFKECVIEPLKEQMSQLSQF